MTSMFGLVLAIGIVVDDAIVVVEAVQRHIAEGMTSRDATIRAMDEGVRPGRRHRVYSCAAVFIPRSLSGRHFRPDLPAVRADHRGQRAALRLHTRSRSAPALAALILRPKKESRRGVGKFFEKFDQAFEWTRKISRRRALPDPPLGFRTAGIGSASRSPPGVLFRVVPKGFLPDEDQGVLFVAGPPARWRVARAQHPGSRGKWKTWPDRCLASRPSPLSAGPISPPSTRQLPTSATIIVTLKPWDERKTPDTQIDALLRRANGIVQPGAGRVRLRLRPPADPWP